eukprot:TRINITY_DN30944_c0_g3_i3.p3 TRINITY_DN30944_c0_g3~~TRINITY_DN30944_c0_g3_i3.p3  ORF type:complete len:131 (+),score=1.81 TRINITY_DN30944_c0_g3_i3:223-615(+)
MQTPIASKIPKKMNVQDLDLGSTTQIKTKTKLVTDYCPVIGKYAVSISQKRQNTHDTQRNSHQILTEYARILYISLDIVHFGYIDETVSILKFQIQQNKNLQLQKGSKNQYKCSCKFKAWKIKCSESTKT